MASKSRLSGSVLLTVEVVGVVVVVPDVEVEHVVVVVVVIVVVVPLVAVGVVDDVGSHGDGRHEEVDEGEG